MDHHTVELTIGIEVRGIETTIVTLQRREYGSRRDAALLTLGHIDVNHVLRIVRVIRGLSHLELRTLVQLCNEVLHDIIELRQVTTRTVLHHQRDTRVGREARNHRRRECQNRGIFNMSRLDEYLGSNTCCIIRIEEETIDTVALPETTDFPPESFLTFLKGLQLNDKCCLVRTCTSDEVISLDLLTALDSGIGSQDRVYLIDNLTRARNRGCRRHRNSTEHGTRILIRHKTALRGEHGHYQYNNTDDNGQNDSKRFAHQLLKEILILTCRGLESHVK